MSTTRTTHTGQGRLHGCEYVIEACERWGFFCLPVNGENKEPMMRDYLNRALNDSDEIKSWHRWATGRLGYEPLWGVAPNLTRLLPVDVDTKPPKQGQLTFDWFAIINGWPDTRMSRSPSGGFHLWYRRTADQPHLYHLGRPNTSHPDIDYAQYLVLPGGPVRKDGGRYVWTNDLPIADAPQWIFDDVGKHYEKECKGERMSGPRRSRSTTPREIPAAVIALDQPGNVRWAIDYLQKDAPFSQGGEGGEWAMFQIGAVLKDHGISLDLALALVNEHYNNPAHCNPLWSDQDELRAKLRNGYVYSTEYLPGEDTAEYAFADEPFDPDKIKTDITEDEVRRQAEGRRLVEQRRASGAPIIRTDAQGRRKTRRFVMLDGVKIPVFEKD